jgi:peptide/nickel transport system ATP-binding protein
MTRAGEPLLQVQGLQVHFPIKRGVFVDRTVGHVRAVDGVDLAIDRGTTYGLVGESGCGKSTLGRAVLRLVEPTAGQVLFDGTDVASLRGEPLRAHGLGGGRAGIATRVRELLDAVGLPTAALRRYPHEFSGGQRQRIGIARAISLEPDLLIADEPVSALDVSVQAQVVNLLEELQQRLGLTYLVIAHDLAVVRHISDVVGVMYLGSLVEQAPSGALYDEPLHPYTRALMSAVPVPDPVVEERRERILLAGDLPSPADPPSGCRFHTRCPWRQETRCDDEVPVLRELAPGHSAGPHPPRHLVSCHWAEEIRDGVLRPRSADEVAATQGVSVRATGADGAFETDALVQGVDEPIERR